MPNPTVQQCGFLHVWLEVIHSGHCSPYPRTTLFDPAAIREIMPLYVLISADNQTDYFTSVLRQPGPAGISTGKSENKYTPSGFRPAGEVMK
ncbi:hypothetical protein FDZ73_09265 [bacterium]|nr:MAG: hypothetical protein FDZ73_09265 [bacterium]